MASPSNIPKVARDGSMLIEGDGTVAAFTVDYEQGNVSFGLEKASRAVIRARGLIKAVRKVDDPVFTISFSVWMWEWTNGTDATILDTAQFSGAWATQGSTAGVPSDFDLVDITMTTEGTDLGDSADGTIKFSDCILIMTGFSEGAEGNVYNFTAECYGGFARTGQA